jgi:hypothetical protein
MGRQVRSGLPTATTTPVVNGPRSLLALSRTVMGSMLKVVFARTET